MFHFVDTFLLDVQQLVADVFNIVVAVNVLLELFDNMMIPNVLP